MFDNEAVERLLIQSNNDQPKQKDKGSNKSAFKGVFRCGKKFKAQIQTNGVQHYLGIFDTEEAAARAYDDHARAYLGLSAKTNFTYSSPDSELSSGLHIQSLVSLQHQEMIKNSSEIKKRANNEENDDASSKLAHPRRIYSGKKMKLLTSSNRFASSVLSIQHTTPQQVSYISNPALLLQHNESTKVLPAQNKIPSATGWDSPEGFTISARVQPMNHNILAASNKQHLAPPSFDEMIHSNVHYEESSHLQPANNSLYYPQKSDKLPHQVNQNLHEADNDEDGEDEVDWRLQIYYWVGQFDLDRAASSSRFCWKGCWLGSFVGRPSEEDFATSSNAFEYVTDSVSISDNIKVATAEGDLYVPSETVFHGYYMMVNDSAGNLEKFLDKGIVMHFMRQESNFLYGGDSNSNSDTTNTNILTVVGRGDSEFGVFFLHGTWDSSTKTLEMCRQYLLDTDIRVDMDLDEYKQHLRLSGLPV